MELREWIEPRLTVMRASIEAEPISGEAEGFDSRPAREAAVCSQKGDPTQTTGVFIRSDTNVEDLDDFNGAGLNLTLFDRRALDDVFAGLKEVWASPFTYRSFSWRQALIDEPLWVLPSVVILESIPTEKSGVLVTIDVDRPSPRFAQATSAPRCSRSSRSCPPSRSSSIRPALPSCERSKPDAASPPSRSRSRWPCERSACSPPPSTPGSAGARAMAWAMRDPSRRRTSS